MSQAPWIAIQQISFTYAGYKTSRGEVQPIAALRDVTLSIQPGEYLALLGHNGSGKSTLARQCNALLTPDSGHVRVAVRVTAVQANPRALCDKVGMIFRSPEYQI